MGRIYPTIVKDAAGNAQVRDMNRAWCALILEPADHDALQAIAAQEGLTGRQLLERELRKVVDPLIQRWPERKAQLEAAGQLKTGKVVKAAPPGLSPEQLAEREAKERERLEKKAQREAAAAERKAQQEVALKSRREQLQAQLQKEQAAAQERQRQARAEAEAKAQAQREQRGSGQPAGAAAR